MFDRKAYKKTALAQLKGRWKIPCISSAICFVISLLFSLSISKTKGINVIRFDFITLIFIAYIGVQKMLQSYIHLKLARTTGKLSMDDIFIALGDYWHKGILGILWFSLWTYLWSILFVIPGIVKAISYSQMFFIMTENPKIGARKAMNISKILTNGHKADLFVMGLTFSGWMLLAMITKGFGGIWLSPYMTTSFANAYTDLKMEAFRTKKLTPADFSA